MARDPASRGATLRARLRHPYHGAEDDARRFRYGILAIDLATVLFVIGTSFTERTRVIEVLDVTIGLLLFPGCPSGWPHHASRCARLSRPARWSIWWRSPPSSPRSPATARASSASFAR